MKKSLQKIVTVIVLLLFSLKVGAQSCAHTDRNPWTWPGHNNWFLANWAPNDGSAHILNQRTGVMTKVVQTNYNAPNRETTSIRAYEGVAAASNDQGKLVFFTNGRKAWKADGTLITSQLKQGNECGSVADRGSAGHGVMILRHPLQPRFYYVVTIDDVVNQGCGVNGVQVAIVDSSGNLVNASQPIDGFTGEGRAAFRTTEGIGATMHGNGVDVWMTVQPLNQTYYLSYLLTCEGFVTAPVVSNNVATKTAIAMGNGAMAFSWDGEKFAAGHNVNSADAANAPDYGYRGVNLYDFDNMTGKITNRKAVMNGQWAGFSIYNVIFSTDNNELHYSGVPAKTGKVNVNAGSAANIRASTTASPFLVGDYRAAAMTYDGKIVNRNTVNAQHPQLGGPNENGMNDMFIPPLEEPDITEVGPFCNDLDSIIDLKTVWLCSQVNSELAIKQADATHGYFGNGIVAGDSAQINGWFNPSKAGAGRHMIEFRFCGVDDTIYIDVEKCVDCIDTLKNVNPIICAGETYQLKALIDTANGPGIWSIDSVPTTLSVDATIDDSTVDTLFDATNLATKPGVYKVMYTVTKDAETCKDSVYVRVNKNPIVEVNSDTICFGEPAVVFTAVTDSAVATHLWSDNGTGTSATTSGSTAGKYTITVTDNNGCVGSDTGLLKVNAIPVVEVNNDTICVGDLAATFTATVDSAVQSYTWADFGSGNLQTTTGTQAGIYTVVVVDVNNCTSQDTGTLVVHALPVVSVNSDTICEGDPSAIFTATSNVTVQTYSWGINGTGNQVTTTGNTDGAYEVVVTDINGCIEKDTGYLKVNKLPVVAVNDSAICFGDPDASFTVVSDSAILSTTWLENGLGQSGTTITGNTAGNYKATVIDVNGCINSGTGVLKINKLPVVTVNSEEICDGATPVTFTLTSDSVSVSQVWSDNGTGNLATTTGTTAGDYTVTVTDNNGCVSSGTGTLIVNTNPTVTLNGGTVCPGSTQTLDPVITDGTPAFQYSWDSGETTPSITKGAGTYVVTITDWKNCVGTASASVVESGALTVTMDNPIELCKGEDSTLVSNYRTVDGYSFNWVKDGTPTGQTTDRIVVNTSGTYQVAVNKGTCAGTGQVLVTVHDLPTVTVENKEICQGEAAATFTAVSSTATNWEWSENGTGNTSTTTGAIAGNYTVIISDVNNCKDTAVGTLTVHSLPTVSVSNQIICEGTGGATFTAVSPTATTYLWSGVGTGTTADISGTTPGIYTVTVNDVNNCSATESATLTVNKNPIVSVQGAALCEGASAATLAVVSDSTLTSAVWSGDGTGTGMSYTTSSEGTYVVDVVDENGCLGNASATVTVELLPLVVTETASICAGASAASAGQPIAGGIYNYLWSSGETTATISTSVEQVLTRIATSVPGGCSSTSTYTIEVNDNPTITVDNEMECENDVLTLFDKGSTTNCKYEWSPGNYTGSSITPTPTATATTVYTVIKTDTTINCSVTAYATATFVPIPNVNIVPDTVTICAGEAATVTAIHDADAIVWDNRVTTNTTSFSNEGTYIVTAINGTCNATDQVAVKIIEYPVSELNKALERQLICFEELDTVLTINAGSNSTYNYQWNTGENTSMIAPLNEGTYNVSITAHYGDSTFCSIQDRITLTNYCPWSLYVPNAFTPDDDGLNDVFYAKGSNLVEFNLRVYDRWGLLVFESDDVNHGWDGTFRENGVLVQMDVYVWKINFSVEDENGLIDDMNRIGTVTVVR